MGVRFRGCILVAAVVLGAISLTLDSTDVISRGLSIWGIAAAFAIFAAMAGWQIIEMQGQLTDAQRKVVVTALGDPGVGAGANWRSVQHDADNERVTHATADVVVTLQNRNEREQKVTAAYIELYGKRRWYWWKKQHIANLGMTILNKRTDTFDKKLPLTWVIPTELEPDTVKFITFDTWFDRAKGPKYRRHWDMQLKIEFGGTDRMKVVPISAPK